jgi:hypothetical protein
MVRRGQALVAAELRAIIASVFTVFYDRFQALGAAWVLASERPPSSTAARSWVTISWRSGDFI